MKPLSPRNLLVQLTGILSQPCVPCKTPCKPDMRTTRARSLFHVCDTTHHAIKYERRPAPKFGGRRWFSSDAFAQALTLPDKEFNKLITTLTTIKKFNQ